MFATRTVMLGLAASAFISSHSFAQQAQPSEPAAEQTENWTVGYIVDAPFNIPIVDLERLDPRFHRQTVAYDGAERPGTVVVDVDQRLLYLVGEDGTATRYGIGVGRDGFAWTGHAQIRRKAAWPNWTPPASMLLRRPELPVHMAGGLANPLGARAMYLYDGDRDTLFRIHGTNEPWSIGDAVSSGCIRMLNEDVFDLYNKVPVGAQVVVRSHSDRMPSALNVTPAKRRSKVATRDLDTDAKAGLF